MPNFLDENGLQQLKTNLDNLYARRAAITAGTAGSTSSETTTLSIPYVTMNDAGIVTGYGTKSQQVISSNLTAPTVSYSQQSKSSGTKTLYRHTITITRNVSNGATVFLGSTNISSTEPITSGTYNPITTKDNYSAGSFSSSTITLYTDWTKTADGNRVSWLMVCYNVNGSQSSPYTFVSASTSGTTCNCSCSCDCGCGCSCDST